jgi:hypothetical protein
MADIRTPIEYHYPTFRAPVATICQMTIPVSFNPSTHEGEVGLKKSQQVGFNCPLGRSFFGDRCVFKHDVNTCSWEYNYSPVRHRFAPQALDAQCQYCIQARLSSGVGIVSPSS